MANIVQRALSPDKPRILANERIYVYVPNATISSPGLSQYDPDDFIVNNGHVSERWDMRTLVEILANPIVRPSYAKVLSDEFINTKKPTSIRHPVYGTEFTSNTAEIALNRADRDAFARPDLVMLDSMSDFEVQDTSGVDEAGDTVNFVKYTIKRNNPINEASLVYVDGTQFDYSTGKLRNKYPYLHIPSTLGPTNGYGLVDIDQHYIYMDPSNNHKLSVNLNAVINSMQSLLDTRPTYGANAASGFADIDQYVDSATGLAKRNAAGETLLKLTKDAVGLHNVQDRDWSDYAYAELNQDIKDNLNARLNGGTWNSTVYPGKVDKNTWNAMFYDWNPSISPIDKSTPFKWLEYHDQWNDSQDDAIASLNTFLGYFLTVVDLETAYPPSLTYSGSNAYVSDTTSYWAEQPKYFWRTATRNSEIGAVVTFDDMLLALPNSYHVGDKIRLTVIDHTVSPTVTTTRYLVATNDAGLSTSVSDWVDTESALMWQVPTQSSLSHITSAVVDNIAAVKDTEKLYRWNGSAWVFHADMTGWEWYNTGVENLSFYDFMETQSSALQPNAPVASISAGQSGKWIQSDHVHPTDLTRLGAEIYKAANVEITTQPYSASQTNNFKFRNWDLIADTTGNAMNARFTVDTAADLSTITGVLNLDVAATRDTYDLYYYQTASGTWILMEIGAAVWPSRYVDYPNRDIVVNVPYVAEGQTSHNWQASPASYVPNASGNIKTWLGNNTDDAGFVNHGVLGDNAIIITPAATQIGPQDIIFRPDMETYVQNEIANFVDFSNSTLVGNTTTFYGVVDGLSVPFDPTPFQEAGSYVRYNTSSTDTYTTAQQNFVRTNLMAAGYYDAAAQTATKGIAAARGAGKLDIKNPGLRSIVCTQNDGELVFAETSTTTQSTKQAWSRICADSSGEVFAKMTGQCGITLDVNQDLKYYDITVPTGPFVDTRQSLEFTIDNTTGEVLSAMFAPHVDLGGGVSELGVLSEDEGLSSTAARSDHVHEISSNIPRFGTGASTNTLMSLDATGKLVEYANSNSGVLAYDNSAGVDVLVSSASKYLGTDASNVVGWYTLPVTPSSEGTFAIQSATVVAFYPTGWTGSSSITLNASCRDTSNGNVIAVTVAWDASGLYKITGTYPDAYSLSVWR